MWTMWFIYYMHTNQLYSIYSNLGAYTGKQDVSFVINRMEVGIHIPRKRDVNITRLLNVWKNEYVRFPNKPTKLDWDGTFVPDDSHYNLELEIS